MIPKKLKELIMVEHGEIGVRETGINFVKYNDWYWGQGVGGTDFPWCVAFQYWCVEQVGGIPFPRTAHCRDVREFAQKNGRWVSAPFEIGDFVIKAKDSHIGFVVDKGNGTDIITIEGNYEDKVGKYVRRASEFVGAYRPEYGDLELEDSILDEPISPVDETIEIPEPVATAQELTSHATEALQLLLEYRGYKTKSKKLSGRMDGERGPGTDAALRVFQGSTDVTEETWHKLIWGW